MATDSDERKVFNKWRDVFTRQLGRKALYDSELERAVVQHIPLGKAWAGIFPVDKVKMVPYKYYIINTDPAHKPGEHWIAMYTTKNNAYVYDSYGRPIDQLAPKLVETIKAAGYQLAPTNRVPHAEQTGFTSQLCGVYCLAFLSTVYDWGIIRARNI